MTGRLQEPLTWAAAVSLSCTRPANCQSVRPPYCTLCRRPNTLWARPQQLLSLGAMHMQAYTTPRCFVDDWLNDYHDAKAAQRQAGAGQQESSDAAAASSEAAAPRAGSPPPPPQHGDGSAHSNGHSIGFEAPGEPEQRQAVHAEQQQAGAEQQAADAGQPQPCIAMSDYRFVYMGPKVCASEFCS